MRRAIILALAVAALASSAGCVNTQLVNVWSDPAARGSVRFTHVMALVISKDQVIQRVGEDALVAQFQGTRATAAYRLISNEDLRNRERANQSLKAVGIDGVVTMRLVNSTRMTTWLPGAYPTFWGYYGWAYPMVYSPGYLVTDQVVRLETDVYDLKDDKLVWAGMSDTFNPASTQSLVTEVSKSVVTQLKQLGFVQ